MEIVESTNAIQLEFEFYRSKQTQVNTGFLAKIINSIASIIGLAGGITFPQQQAVAATIEGVTKPIQDIATALSEQFEPMESLKKVKSVAFLPGIAVTLSNVAAYAAEVDNAGQTTTYSVRTYAAVIPSIISLSLDGDCHYPQYSDDPNSILRAAVTPANQSIEQLYKNDNIRRTFLAQLGSQKNKSDLVEACNSIKEDLRKYFGGFDVYAVSWAILASRENNFEDKTAARECLTTSEKKIMYDRLHFPKLFGET
ncbi:hypothetical protein UNPF46_17635 [Bradyrhizobium sp. UNPF46]|nr:hypothetical protein UNPF46_17635 [Bradyrhizobium sp. UNPF46]